NFAFCCICHSCCPCLARSPVGLTFNFLFWHSPHCYVCCGAYHRSQHPARANLQPANPPLYKPVSHREPYDPKTCLAARSDLELCTVLRRAKAEAYVG